MRKYKYRLTLVWSLNGLSRIVPIGVEEQSIGEALAQVLAKEDVHLFRAALSYEETGIIIWHRSRQECIDGH